MSGQQWGFDGTVGAVGGGALSTDTAPNSATPSSDRMSRLKKRTNTSRAISVFALNGTTISVVPWVYEEGTETWLQLHAAIVATPSSPGSATVIETDGALVFMQVSANTGVEQFGWVYG